MGKGIIAALALAAVAGCGEAEGTVGDRASGAEPSPSRAAPARGTMEVEPGEPPSRTLRVVAVGDVLFGRYHLDGHYKRIPLAAQPFADIAPVVAAADVAIANLESPVADEPAELRLTGAAGSDSPWSLTFRASPDDLTALADAGFDALSLANNHARDLGPAAVSRSRQHVEAAGLRAMGVGRTPAEARAPIVFEANGVTLAVIAWTAWLKGLEGTTPEGAVALASNRRLARQLADEVVRVKRETGADFLAVSIHWGKEWRLEPEDSQRRVAHRIIDAGAHLVLGHHPHVVQSFERYRHGVIAYSLGNFMFDTGGREPRRSAVLEVTLDATGDAARVRTPVLHPVLIHPRTRAPMRARRGGYRAWSRDLRQRAPGFAIAPEPAPID